MKGTIEKKKKIAPATAAHSALNIEASVENNQPLNINTLCSLLVFASENLACRGREREKKKNSRIT